jgi:5-methylcytosine-specific restriction enzyme A
MSAPRQKIDVPTTKRKPLTPRQRLKLFEAAHGICCICHKKIDGTAAFLAEFIDEHIKALGLGGDNDIKNRGVAHVKCALTKTLTQDMPRIVKAKAQKAAQIGKPASLRPLQNRPFPETVKPQNPKHRPPVARKWKCYAEK